MLDLNIQIFELKNYELFEYLTKTHNPKNIYTIVKSETYCCVVFTHTYLHYKQ